MRPIETPVSVRRVSGREGPVVQFVSRRVPSQVRKWTAATPRAPSGGLEKAKGRMGKEYMSG